MRLIGRELLLAALAAAVGAQDIHHPSAAGVCPAGLSGRLFLLDQSCYEFNGVQLRRDEARTNCSKRGGRLVSIRDADQQSWLSNIAAQLWPQNYGVWIGLKYYSNKGVFLWDNYGTGAAYRTSYRNWASNSGSGNCVYMRRDDGRQWLTDRCDGRRSYNYICEYRVAATLNVSTTSPGTTVITPVADVTFPVESPRPATLFIGSLTPVAGHRFTTEYPLVVLSSSAGNNATPVAGMVASNRGVVLPLSLSAAVVVVVVALIAVAVVVRRRQQRSGLPKGSTVSWTRSDDDEGTMVDNPMYSDASQLAVDQATVIHGGGSHGLPGRPLSNSNAEASYALSSVVNPQESVADCLTDLDTGETYAEPLIQEPSASIAAEPATQYENCVYVDADSLLKLQQPAMSVDKAASTNNGQQRNQKQPVHGSRSAQDDYESIVTEWTLYENV